MDYNDVFTVIYIIDIKIRPCWCKKSAIYVLLYKNYLRHLKVYTGIVCPNCLNNITYEVSKFYFYIDYKTGTYHRVLDKTKDYYYDMHDMYDTIYHMFKSRQIAIPSINMPEKTSFIM